jgi:formylglycine-generating enzyme required for sulfatase activity
MKIILEPVKNEGKDRFIYGGSWFVVARFARGSSRYRRAPSLRDPYRSFRLARNK